MDWETPMDRMLRKRAATDPKRKPVQSMPPEAKKPEEPGSEPEQIIIVPNPQTR